MRGLFQAGVFMCRQVNKLACQLSVQKKYKKSCRVMRSSRNLQKMITFAAVFRLVNEKRVIILIKIK